MQNYTRHDDMTGLVETLGFKQTANLLRVSCRDFAQQFRFFSNRILLSFDIIIPTKIW